MLYQLVLVATGYTARCPECDMQSITSVVTPLFKCQYFKCGASFPVVEVRHRTTGDDIQPGIAPGALIRPPDENDRSKALKREKVDLVLLPNAGVIQIATGYAWKCQKCSADNYENTARWPHILCAACRAEHEVTQVRHKTVDGLVLPGIAPEKIYIPPVVEYNPLDSRQQSRDEAEELIEKKVKKTRKKKGE